MSKDLFFYNTAIDGKPPRVVYDGSRSVADKIEPWEKTLIERHWESVKQPGWFDGNPGCLWDASKKGLTYIKMPFSIYNAVAHFQEMRIGDIFPEYTRRIVRALTLGCYIESSDEMILVQERGKGLLAEGRLDISSTGVGNITGNTINLEAMVLEKIKAELNLGEEDLEPLVFTGNHEPGDYPSSMCTFRSKANREFGKIKEGVDKRRIPKLYGVPKDVLPVFLINHYVGRNEPQLIGDGVSTLMRSLEPEQFDEVVEGLKREGINVNFGMIKDREFVED